MPYLHPLIFRRRMERRDWQRDVLPPANIVLYVVRFLNFYVAFA